MLEESYFIIDYYQELEKEKEKKRQSNSSSCNIGPMINQQSSVSLSRRKRSYVSWMPSGHRIWDHYLTVTWILSSSSWRLHSQETAFRRQDLTSWMKTWPVIKTSSLGHGILHDEDVSTMSYIHHEASIVHESVISFVMKDITYIQRLAALGSRNCSSENIEELQIPVTPFLSQESDDLISFKIIWKRDTQAGHNFILLTAQPSSRWIDSMIVNLFHPSWRCHRVVDGEPVFVFFIFQLVHHQGSDLPTGSWMPNSIQEDESIIVGSLVWSLLLLADNDFILLTAVQRKGERDSG